MIPVMCIVQQNQISEGIVEALQADINHFTLRAFNEQAQINWISIPEGDGFTAAEPSKTIIISLHANEALTTDKRITLLNQLCDLAQHHTGLSANEIVTSVRDPQE